MLYLKADVTKPVSYISCGQFVSDGNWIHDKRNIDSFEIIYGLKGCVYMQQDDERFEVAPGKVLLLLPGHEHKGYKESESEVSFYWIHFKCGDTFELLPDKAAQSLMFPLSSGAYLNNTCHFVMVPVFFRPNESEKLTVQIRQLLHCAYSKNYMALTNNYLLTLVLMELSQQVVSSASNDLRDETSRKFSEIIEWLRINISKNYSVAEIAEKFNFNKDYLCRIFKKHTGISVVKYINGVKISKAKELLCCSEFSIKEISYSLGFSDDKYFMKLFKAYEKLTPSEYRGLYYRTHLNDK